MISVTDKGNNYRQCHSSHTTAQQMAAALPVSTTSADVAKIRLAKTAACSPETDTRQRKKNGLDPVGSDSAKCLIPSFELRTADTDAANCTLYRRPPSLVTLYLSVFGALHGKMIVGKDPGKVPFVTARPGNYSLPQSKLWLPLGGSCGIRHWQWTVTPWQSNASAQRTAINIHSNPTIKSTAETSIKYPDIKYDQISRES